jgi:hypothetical protein
MASPAVIRRSIQRELFAPQRRRVSHTVILSEARNIVLDRYLVPPDCLADRERSVLADLLGFLADASEPDLFQNAAARTASGRFRQ